MHRRGRLFMLDVKYTFALLFLFFFFKQIPLFLFFAQNVRLVIIHAIHCFIYK